MFIPSFAKLSHVGDYSQQCEKRRAVKEVPRFGSIKWVQNYEYIPHAMKNHVLLTGDLICIYRYGCYFILWVGHGSCACKISAVGKCSFLFLKTSGAILGGMENTLVVAPFFI